MRNVLQDVGRLTSRARRQAIARVPPVRRMADGQYERRLRRYRSRLPRLAESDQRVVDRLGAEGVHVTSLADLGMPHTTPLCAALEQLTGLLASREGQGVSTVRPTRAELLEDLAVWRWGLDERLLDIVESYLGVPARYYGADVRRELADGRSGTVRQWHRDIEDRRTLKILVWLNDVDENGGPFAYIPVERSQQASRALRYVSGFVSDDRMRQQVPEALWRTCPGPRWTAILADNCRLLHRATPPVSRDRYSVTFTWSSRHPVRTIPQPPFAAAEVARIRDGLNERQLACLPLGALRVRQTSVGG